MLQSLSSIGVVGRLVLGAAETRARQIRPTPRLPNHSGHLRLSGSGLDRVQELFEEARQGQHHNLMAQREELKQVPTAPEQEVKDALESMGLACNIPASDTSAWARHFARLREHMVQRAVAVRAPRRRRRHRLLLLLGYEKSRYDRGVP